MTRYDEILKVIAEGEPTYPWKDPKDILEGIAALWIKHLGCTPEQFNYMKRDFDRRVDLESDVAVAESDNRGSYACKIYFHYDKDSPTSMSTLCFILILTRADKEELVAAYGEEIGAQMAIEQEAGRAPYSYFVSDSGSDGAHFITPGAVSPGNMFDELTAELRLQGAVAGLRERTSKVV